MEDELKFTDILERYIGELDQVQNPAATIYQLFKDNLLDKIAIRNYCLLLDFDIKLKKNGKDTLSFGVVLSEIRNVVSN